MTTIATLVTKLTADATSFRREMSSTQSMARKWASSVSGSIRSAGKVIAGLATVAAGAATAVGWQLIKLGSWAEEMEAKFNTIFPNVGGVLKENLQEFADAVGRNRFELQKWASDIGDLLKPIGFTEVAAAELSESIVTLAVDIASFNNLPTAKVMFDMQSAVIGNTAALKKYGIIANVATQKQKALEMGLDPMKLKTDAAARAMVIWQIILDSSKDAMGDATRTAGSFENQMRRLTGKIREMATEFGVRLIPAATPVINILGDIALIMGDKLIRFAERLGPAFEFLGKSLLAIGRNNDARMAIFNLSLGIGELLRAFGASQETINKVVAPLVSMGTAMDNGATFSEALKDELLKLIPQGLKDAVETLNDKFGQYVTKVGEFFAMIGENMGELIQFKDVMAALATVTSVFLLSGLISLVGALLPVIVVIALLTVGIALLRKAWEENWGDIQGKTQEAFDTIVPILEELMQGRMPAIFQEGIGKAASTFLDLFAKIEEFVRLHFYPIIFSIQRGIESFMENSGDAFAAFIPLGEDFKELWVTIKPLLAAVGGFLALVVAGIIAIIPAVLSAAPHFIKFIAGAIGMFVRLATNIIKALGKIGEFIGAVFSNDMEGAKTAFLELQSLLLSAAADLVGSMLGLIANLVMGVLTFFLTLSSESLSILTGMFETITGTEAPAFLQNLTDIMRNVKDSVLQLFDELITNASDTWHTGLEGIKKIAQDAFDLLLTIVDTLVEDLMGLWDNLVERMQNAFDAVDWGQIGRDILGALVGAININGGSVVSSLISVARNALEGVKAFLGIESPSKVFRKQIGEQIVKGMVKGIEDNQMAFDNSLAFVKDSPFGNAGSTSREENVERGRSTTLVFEGPVYGFDDFAEKVEEALNLKLEFIG